MNTTPNQSGLSCSIVMNVRDTGKKISLGYFTPPADKSHYNSLKIVRELDRLWTEFVHILSNDNNLHIEDFGEHLISKGWTENDDEIDDLEFIVNHDGNVSF